MSFRKTVKDQQSTDYTKMNIRLQNAEAKINALQLGQSVPPDLEAKAEQLRQQLLALKQKMQKRMEADDKYKLAYLEGELGRILILMENMS